MLVYQGHTGISLNETTGDLVIETPARQIIDEAPVAYQEVNGTRTEVECSYVLGHDASVTFALGES